MHIVYVLYLTIIFLGTESVSKAVKVDIRYIAIIGNIISKCCTYRDTLIAGKKISCGVCVCVCGTAQWQCNIISVLLYHIGE